MLIHNFSHYASFGNKTAKKYFQGSETVEMHVCSTGQNINIKIPSWI